MELYSAELECLALVSLPGVTTVGVTLGSTLHDGFILHMFFVMIFLAEINGTPQVLLQLQLFLYVILVLAGKFLLQEYTLSVRSNIR